MTVKTLFFGDGPPMVTCKKVEIKQVATPIPVGLDIAPFQPDVVLVSREASGPALKFLVSCHIETPIFLLAAGPGAFLQAQLDGFDGAIPEDGITGDALREAIALAMKKRRAETDPLISPEHNYRFYREKLETRLAIEQSAQLIISEYAFCSDLKEFLSMTDAGFSAIGPAHEVDRVYLFLFENGLASNVCEWCAPGVESQKDRLQNISLDVFPRLIHRLKRGVPFAIDDVSEIPPESWLEKERLMSDDIRSLVIFPVESGDGLTGFLGMDNLPAKTMNPREDYPILSIISQVMGKALELIRIREEQRETMERYRTIVESDSTLIVRFLPDCTILFCNRAYAKYIGGTPEDFIGRNLGEARNKDVSYLVEAFAKLTPEAPRRLMENYATMPNGQTAWQLFNDLGIFDEDGRLKEIQSVGWDITDLKLAKLAEESEKRKALALFEHSPEAIIASWDGVFVSDANDAFCRISGLQKDEVTGRPLAEKFCFQPAEGSPDMAALMKKAVLGEPALTEGVFRTRRGSDLYLSILALPVTGSSGENRGLYLFFRDLTEIKGKERELTANVAKLNRSFSQTIEVLALTVESRDPYTAGHQRRTALLSEAIAARMGLDEERRRGMYLAAAIHDVGKISVPAEILSKPGLLQPVEMNLVKTHSEEGYLILKKADFPWRLAEIVRQHHERLDGSGYPQGLRGDEILTEAKILAVADVVEAMASHRPYRPSLGADAALNFVEEGAGSLFDPLAVKACREVFEAGFTFGGDSGL